MTSYPLDFFDSLMFPRLLAGGMFFEEGVYLISKVRPRQENQCRGLPGTLSAP